MTGPDDAQRLGVPQGPYEAYQFDVTGLWTVGGHLDARASPVAMCVVATRTDSQGQLHQEAAEFIAHRIALCLNFCDGLTDEELRPPNMTARDVVQMYKAIMS